MPTPTPTPTIPAYYAVSGDAGYANGEVSAAYLPQHSVTESLEYTNAFEDLDSIGYSASANAGILANGASQNVVPFAMSGTGITLGNQISLANPTQCVDQNQQPTGCDATAVVMPDANTAILAVNTTGSNYLLEISGVNSPNPVFQQIPIGVGSAEDTAGLAMSPDGHVLVSRGAHFDVFTASGTDAYSQLSQIAQADGPDHNALRAREGMAVFITPQSDYELLAAGTSENPQNGTLSLYTGLQTGNTNRTTSTRIDPSLHAYAVTTDGTTAFVGTDVGIAIVPGVNTQAFQPDTTSVVSPASCSPGANLAQISSIALTPDDNWLVVMGLPFGASGPGGVSGCLEVLPVSYGASGATLGAPIESLPIVVPYDDQMLVFGQNSPHRRQIHGLRGGKIR